MTSIAGAAFGQSIGSLVLGQSKFSTVSRIGQEFQKYEKPRTLGDLAGRITNKGNPTNQLKYDLLRYATMGGIAAAAAGAVGYAHAMGSTIGSYQTSLSPRGEYGNRSYQEEGGRQMGLGLMTGYGEQYLENMAMIAEQQRIINEENARLWQEYAYNRAYSEQQGRYEGNLDYPTFSVREPGTGEIISNSETQTTKNIKKLPENVRIY